MSNKIDYELKAYKQLAKEFGGIRIDGIRIDKHIVQFLPRDPIGNIYKLVHIIPLTGWITDPKEVERIIRERGMEL